MLLAILLLPFVVLYGLNWLIFHPGIVTAFYSNPLFDTPRSADVIVVLAGKQERARYAALLAETRMAPRILSTLVDPECLRGSGVRERCATGVRNTVDEAVAMRRVLVREKVDRVMVVTSRSHVVRTAAIFTIVFSGTGIDVNVLATPLSANPGAPSVREILSFFPSLGGAALGRFDPELYGWIMQYRSWLSIRGAATQVQSV
ncbi:MAG: YdcF family protein [Nitrospiraceae bacterium]